MLLKEFYAGDNMIVVDFGTKSGSLWEEVGSKKVSSFLRNSTGGGSAVVDDDFLKSNTAGVTCGKFFKRTSNAVSVKCDVPFEKLIEKYKISAYPQYTDKNHFVYSMSIKGIDFNDVTVVLTDEAERYRTEIEKVLSEEKWIAHMIVDAEPDENILEESNTNRYGYISVENIRKEGINTIHTDILIDK